MMTLNGVIVGSRQLFRMQEKKGIVSEQDPCVNQGERGRTVDRRLGHIHPHR